MEEASSTYQSDKEYVESLFCKGMSKQVVFLYRNQTAEYFAHVERNGNVMKPRLKDMVGSPKSPINGRLKGVCFCVNLFNGLFPSTVSPHGKIRMCIPIEAVFNDSSNLYFADFYTYTRNYIILVLTKTGTAADQFCKENLPQLDPQDNVFLYKSRDDGHFYTSAQRGLLVQIFYTENVEIDSLGSMYGPDKVYKMFWSRRSGSFVRHVTSINSST